MKEALLALVCQHNCIASAPSVDAWKVTMPVHTADWERNLTDYCRQHPDVAVIDRVEGIRLLHNRATMLTPLQGEGITVQVSTAWVVACGNGRCSQLTCCWSC
jgi:hypothetical protein